MAETVAEKLRGQDAKPGSLWFRSNGLVAGLLVAALALGWLAHGLFSAPAGLPGITIYDGWRLICPDRDKTSEPCVLTEDATDPKTGKAVMRVSIVPTTPKPTIDILVPGNVLLQSRLGVRIDDKPLQHFAYRTCNAPGCLVTISAEADFYNAMLGAKKIQVVYKGVNGKDVTRDVPLKSFHKAVSAMNEAQAKRHSWLRRVLL